MKENADRTGLGFSKSLKLVALTMGIAVACFGAVPAVKAYASSPNRSDTTYNFYFKGTGSTNATYGRAKCDDSVSYVHIKQLGLSKINLYIDGYEGDCWTNRTRGGVARAVKPGYYNIHNYVWENGEREARLSGWSQAGSGNVSGEWSPDSKGGFTSLN